MAEQTRAITPPRSAKPNRSDDLVGPGHHGHARGVLLGRFLVVGAFGRSSPDYQEAGQRNQPRHEGYDDQDAEKVVQPGRYAIQERPDDLS